MTRKEFIKLYAGENVAVHCSTRKAADEFLMIANSFEYTWNTGCSYADDNCWYIYKDDTCYLVDEGLYGDRKYFENKGYKIVEFNNDAVSIEIKNMAVNKDIERCEYLASIGSAVEAAFEQEDARHLEIRDKDGCLILYAEDIQELIDWTNEEDTDLENDELSATNEEYSGYEPMRECNDCGEDIYIFYNGDGEYKVVCKDCEKEQIIKADSIDEAICAWTRMELHADCEYCPLGWEDRGYEGECYDCGCMVYEDINWCKKPYAERAEKAKELESALMY